MPQRRRATQVLVRSCVTVAAAMLLALAISSPAPAQVDSSPRDNPEFAERPDEQARERALDTVAADARFAELRERFPDVAREVFFSSQYGCWFVEFQIEGREIGFCTVARDGSRILEFPATELTEIAETDEADLEAREREERERDDRAGGFLRRLLPPDNPATLFWVALIVTALVAADFRRPLSLRNLDALSLLALAPFLMGLWSHQRLAFTGIYFVTLYLFARMLVEVFRKAGPRLPSNVPVGALIFLLILGYAYHLVSIRSHGVDDAGIWSVFGAQHVMREGTLPYGHYDDGDTYGPALYLAHVPFVAALPPTYARGGESFVLRPAALGEGVPYETMRFGAAKASAALFDALVLIGLVLIGSRIGRIEVGLAAAVVYAFSPYVIGIGGGGLAWISHVFPTAATVLALLWIRRPAVSGLLLAIGAWSLYYPAFLVPLWAGFHWGRWRRMMWFLAAVAGFSLLMAGLLAWKIEVEGVALGAVAKIRLFLDNTIAFQAQSSWFGFWAQHPGMQFLQPFIKIGYFVFCVALFLLPRRKRVRDVVALSAAVIIGTQLWKPHGGGTYIAWYLPFLILAYLAGDEIERLAGPGEMDARDRESADSWQGRTA